MNVDVTMNLSRSLRHEIFKKCIFLIVLPLIVLGLLIRNRANAPEGVGFEVLWWGITLFMLLLLAYLPLGILKYGKDFFRQTESEKVKTFNTRFAVFGVFAFLVLLLLYEVIDLLSGDKLVHLSEAIPLLIINGILLLYATEIRNKDVMKLQNPLGTFFYIVCILLISSVFIFTFYTLFFAESEQNSSPISKETIFAELSERCLTYQDVLSGEPYNEGGLSYVEEKKFCECYRNHFQYTISDYQSERRETLPENLTGEALRMCTARLWLLGFEKHPRVLLKDTGEPITEEEWNTAVEFVKNDFPEQIKNLPCFKAQQGERWWVQYHENIGMHTLYYGAIEAGFDWGKSSWARNWMYLFEDAVKDKKLENCPEDAYLFGAYS